MWNTFSALAEKAKAAAADLDKQLDETMGMDGSSSALVGVQESLLADDDDDDALNDAWGDDDALESLQESENDEDNFNNHNATTVIPPQEEAPSSPEMTVTTTEKKLAPVIPRETEPVIDTGIVQQGESWDEDDGQLNLDEVDISQDEPEQAPREPVLHGTDQHDGDDQEEDNAHNQQQQQEMEDPTITSNHQAQPTKAVRGEEPLPEQPIQRKSISFGFSEKLHDLTSSVENKLHGLEKLHGLTSSVAAFIPHRVVVEQEKPQTQTEQFTPEPAVQVEEPPLPPTTQTQPLEEEVVGDDGDWAEGEDEIDFTETTVAEEEEVSHDIEPAVEELPSPPPPPSSPPAESVPVASEQESVTPEIIDSSSQTPAQLEREAESLPEITEHPSIAVIPEPALQEETAGTEDDIPPSADPPLPPPTAIEDSELNHKLQEQLTSQQEITRILEQRLDELLKQLQQREDQLFSKTGQLTTIQAMHETEKEELQQRIQLTKDEAKKRIQKAKERVEAMEAKLKSVASAQNSSADGAAQQAELIAELRAEGENLARKQAEMEKAVRSAKGEARELREQLEHEVQAKEGAIEKAAKLEAQLKETKDSLNAARKGESQAGKLEEDLRQAREESERKGSTILSLEQQIKELKAHLKELLEELESTKQGAVVETQREQQKIRKEHNDMINDLDNRLRISEREAAVREDALRLEVDELRKRWQDAVRRADALSMDMQSSTAPLLRQLESAERQNRARAAAAAEVETKLRSDLEETIVSNERLTKERSEWKTKFTRLERKAKEDEELLKTTKQSLEEKTTKVQQLEEKLQHMEKEGAKMKEEWGEVERLANEGVARVRSEMTQTVVESEERYRSQLDGMKAELAKEHEKRRQLEAKVDELLDNPGMIVPPTVAPVVLVREARPKRLKMSQGQEEILAGALGLEDTEVDTDEDDDDEDNSKNEDDAAALQEQLQDSSRRGSNSFAALEELSSRLKSAKVELNALRQRLAETETNREALAEELGEARNAKEKLPLFEQKVQELTAENQEQALEIQALQEDIAEVRELYRSQINMLMVEKTDENNNSAVGGMNGTAAQDASTQEASAPKSASASFEADPAAGGAQQQATN